jgi:antitoxin (DNA-binding transcriptional repressor) of toxin-antitoxin stability system
MEFVTIRELRLQSATVWEKLRQQRELVLTSNGHPVAIIAGINGDEVEEALAAFRRARAQAAVARLRKNAAVTGVAEMSAAEIQAEIEAARRERMLRLAQE